jgi:tetratricopeptide (TPR) repeat protein
VEEILHQAELLEKEYDWPGAVGLYEKALKLLPQDDFSRMGEIHERSGYASYRAAMQAESREEFKNRMCQGVAGYEEAKGSYSRLSEPGKAPRMLRCDAAIAFMRYWLASEALEKKRLLDECWQRTKEALDAFKETGNALEYGRTYNQLSTSAFLRYVLEWSFQAGEKIIREAMEHAEQAVALLSSVGDPYELAEAYVKAAFYLVTFSLYFVPDLDERERHRQKGQDYLQKARELSEEAALLALARTSGGTGDETGLTIDEMLVHFEKALGYAWKTKDKYLIGTALDWLTYATGWKSSSIDDPDKRLELRQRALQYAEDARHQFSSISFVSPRGDLFWTEAPYTQYYWQAAVLLETDPRKRRDLLEKAVIDGTRARKSAETTGYPGIIGYAYSTSSAALGLLAQIETIPEKKKRLLEKAVEYGTKAEEITRQLYPFHYWNRGTRLFLFANLKAEMSNLEKDFENKKKMLEEVSSDKEHALQLCIKESSHFETRGDLSLFAALGFFQYSYGEFLNRLYRLTNSKEHQRKAIRAFEDAAESYKKLNLLSRVAECCWKTARGYDVLGEHLTAAKNFNLASENYKSAAEKILQLKSFYQDHALYMQAWSEIEKARHHHERQEYGFAREHFEKAADVHKSLKQWGYLAPNYSAWANVEHAEELSRKEQCEEAIQAFEHAVKLFDETKKSIQNELNKIEDPDEKQMATGMVKATDMRHEYCTARIALEEAKILDKRGDHYSSSEKYGSAAGTFEEMSQTLETEQERKEFDFIISLSRAWQKMTRAEAEVSPALYAEASQLFEKAKESSPNEQAKMLVLGHSRFCKALEEGTKFADTRDVAMHATATKYLESAANYYVSAGFQKASEYAKATQLLFDAYAQMDNAKRENDPEKKARLYIMAEKVLQTSAGCFMKAEHPEKRERVLRLLEKVQEERELAVSLTEVLHAPSIVSSTAVFATPTPTHEEAVGSERFEHADIQANIIARQKELKVGENLDLEIELVNAGKATALLTKLTEVLPEGFELLEKPETYRMEHDCLDMKGKRLDPLKTEEVKLVLRPKVQGVFPIKPRILYLDENGKYKSHEPEPINITVKELGIKGWLKGER